MRIRRRTVIRGAALLAAGMVACGGGVTERDQWSVWVTTDAPVPQLVDRALVDVLDANGELACGDCRRQLGVPTDPAAWPFSFGVAKPDGARDLRVRVRLYRAASAGPDGLPVEATTLDLVGDLPAPSGNTEVHMVLTAECLGMASDLVGRSSCAGPDRALVPEKMLGTGRPDSTIRPGIWPRAATVACSRASPSDMICIPGGFFVLGDSRALSIGRSPTASHNEERYVTLSPFSIDRDEVTVGAFRALLQAGRLSEPPTARGAATSELEDCTDVGATDPSNDPLPVNCVTAVAAAAACEALGKRLPTEAEWEWVAGNRIEESKYPWGDVDDPCDLADVGLGRSAVETTLPESTACRVRVGQPTRPPGIPAQDNDADVTSLGVRQLGGRLSEWVADRLASYRASCWQPENPFLVDRRSAFDALGRRA
jgi:sulfatase modifying factor 1